jgi:hypothetical protein
VAVPAFTQQTRLGDEVRTRHSSVDGARRNSPRTFLSRTVAAHPGSILWSPTGCTMHETGRGMALSLAARFAATNVFVDEKHV